LTHLLQLLLLLAVILVAAKGAGSLSSRLGLPAVFGEILAGLLLGPTVFNVLGLRIFAPGGDALHPALGGIVHDLAEIGVILLMFVAGMETDLEEMRRVGRAAFWSAAGGVVLPFLLGGLATRLFGRPWVECIFVGAVLTATSVSISAQTLFELGALRTREGTTILGAAVIDDVMGILVLSLVIAFTGSGAAASGERFGITEILLIGGRMALFFGLGWLAGRRFLERITERVRRLPTSQPLMAFVLLVAFGYAFAAEFVGRVAAITGSYLAGLLFAQTRFKGEIDRGIHPVTYSLFVPIFFVDIGLQANGREIAASGRAILFAAVIVAVAILSKIVGCGALARLSGFSPRESLRVGIGMISRGEVGLIVAGYGLAAGVIEREVFSVMVVMVLVTTMVTPILLRMVFPVRATGPATARVVESISHVETERLPPERRKG
jgi:Kef-type K+ transport system membrane component KefB